MDWHWGELTSRICTVDGSMMIIVMRVIGAVDDLMQSELFFTGSACTW